MAPMERFPLLHEFLTKFLGRFWPEISNWSSRLCRCGVCLESFSYSHMNGSNHGVFTTVLLQLFPHENTAKYTESGYVFNTNYGMFIFTVGRHGQINEIEMYFSTPEVPPFFDELIPLHSPKNSQRSKAMIQEARAAGDWTCDEFMDSIDYKLMHIVDMGE